MKLFQVLIYSEWRVHTTVDVKLKVSVNEREVEKLIYKELEEEYMDARNDFKLHIEEIKSVDGYEVVLK